MSKVKYKHKYKCHIYDNQAVKLLLKYQFNIAMTWAYITVCLILAKQEF